MGQIITFIQLLLPLPFSNYYQRMNHLRGHAWEQHRETRVRNINGTLTCFVQVTGSSLPYACIYVSMYEYMYDSVLLELKSDIIFMQLSINISIFIKNEVSSFLFCLLRYMTNIFPINWGHEICSYKMCFFKHQVYWGIICI